MYLIFVINVWHMIKESVKEWVKTFKKFLVGPDYFKRFVKNSDGTRVRFKTSYQVNQYMNQMRHVDQWMRDLKLYIKGVEPELIADRKLIFGIETRIFLTNTEPTRQFCVMVCTCINICNGIFWLPYF